ncbi:MAG: hypothetical protein WAL04_09700 [Acidimicrobiales bacterium]
MMTHPETARRFFALEGFPIVRVVGGDLALGRDSSTPVRPERQRTARPVNDPDRTSPKTAPADGTSRE